MATDHYSMTINGRDVAGISEVDVINPATAKPFAKVPDCTPEQLDEAVAAARAAQPAWAAIPFEERRARVVALHKVVDENMDELMRLLTLEQGKPHADATGELMGVSFWFQTAAGLSLPEDVLEDSEERLSITKRVPLGVIGGILPWNFPLLVFAFKVIPALLAGNTIVCKPSPYTPVATLRFGQMLQKVLPPGVVNVISGGDDLGRWMTDHPGIDKIGFTGSSATGKKIMKGAADTMKRISLELGGNDAAIVLPDVDVKAVSEAIFWGAFKNNGQVCVAAKRVYVHEDIFDAFFKNFTDYADTVKIGDGGEQGTQIGPGQNKMQCARVKELIADSVAQGHTVHTKSKAPEGDGYFLPLTIVENPPEDSRVVVEEAFGPLLPIMKFKDVADVVARANNTPYGLAGSVWSKDVKLAESIGLQLQCGNVWINGIQDSPLTAPIAGHKQSGLGAENGNPGLVEYTNCQTTTIRRKPAAVA